MACSVSSQAQALCSLPLVRDGSSSSLPSISARHRSEISAARIRFGTESLPRKSTVIARRQKAQRSFECECFCKSTAFRGRGSVLRTRWEGEARWRTYVSTDSSEGNSEESTGAAVAVEDPEDSPLQNGEEGEFGEDEQEASLSPVAEQDPQDTQEILGEGEEEELGEDEQEGSLSPEEEQDRQDIQEILAVVDVLKTKRDMSFNEVRLTIIIEEDPREAERRRLLNIEDERGCSKEELGEALVEVYEGRVPQDRITLRALAKEMQNWPNIEDSSESPSRSAIVASPYAKATDTGVDPKVAAERANVDWDSASEIRTPDSKDKETVVPQVVGFSLLYLVSALPIVITIVVVIILFVNSLR